MVRISSKPPQMPLKRAAEDRAAHPASRPLPRKTGQALLDQGFVFLQGLKVASVSLRKQDSVVHPFGPTAVRRQAGVRLLNAPLRAFDLVLPLARVPLLICCLLLLADSIHRTVDKTSSRNPAYPNRRRVSTLRADLL